MADIQSPPNLAQKALISSYVCYVLAALVMCVTAWFVVEGIQATEPASTARYAKVAAGVLLIILEGFAFALASQWREFSPVLRALGWSIFALQLVLMSLAQIAVGTTAGKAAQLSKATVEEIRAQSEASRQAAKSLQDDAARMRSSKYAWKRDEAGKKSDAAAQQTAAAAGAVEKLEKMQEIHTSTPVIEMIGVWGLIALSIALSAIMELAGITLMHVAGKLRSQASGLPVDHQILGMLQEMRGAAPAASPAKQLATPAERPPAAPAPVKEEKQPFGFIPTMAKLIQRPVNDDAPRHDVGVIVDTHVNDTPVNVDTPAKRTRAPRGPRGEIMDTGTGEHDGHRFRRALALIKQGKGRPSQSGLYECVGASRPVADRYLAAWAKSGEIVPNPDGPGWIVAKGGAA